MARCTCSSLRLTVLDHYHARAARRARQAAAEVAATFDVLQVAWSWATPEQKRALVLALFEALYADVETKANR